MDGRATEWCAPSGCVVRWSSRVFMPQRPSMYADIGSRMFSTRWCASTCGPSPASRSSQETVHLRDDVRRIRCRGDAQEIVLLEVLRRVVAQPLLDLLRKSIQVRIAIDIEAWQNLHQVEDVGHQ